MPVKSRVWILFASVLGCQLLFSSAAQPAGEQQLGRILYSNATTLRGVAVPKSEIILSGDVLSTFDNGNAIVELMSGAKLRITGNTSVRFLGIGDKVQADLLAGAVVSESVGKPRLVVTTSNYHFTPSQEGNCRFAVGLSKQRDTVAGAMQGNLLVMTADSLGRYILPEGEYAAIPASSIGVPAQEKTGGEPNSEVPAGVVREAIPEEVVQRHGAAEVPLKLRDSVNPGDIIRTLKNGRVRIELLDGSFLNLGVRSVMRIVNQDAAAQLTQLELTQGDLRAEVARFTRPDASFEIRTMTATISVAGNGVRVNALTNLTEVYCAEGACSVRNIDPAIPGQVTLHGGESTTVPGGLSPTAPVQTSPTQWQGQTKLPQTKQPQTEQPKTEQPEVQSPAEAPVEPGGQSGAAKRAPWRIGSLSSGSSLLLVIGIGVGAAAAAAVAATSGHSGGAASPSAP